MRSDTLTPRVSDDATSPDAASRIRILICDDHAMVRGGIRRLLEAEQDFDVVAEAPDAAAAVAGVGESAPDVVVMDVRMPGASGINACREIRARFSATRVLMLTSFDDDETRCAAIGAGASGYILKQIRGDGLVDGIREVAAGNSLFSSQAIASAAGGPRREVLASGDVLTWSRNVRHPARVLDNGSLEQ